MPRCALPVLFAAFLAVLSTASLRAQETIGGLDPKVTEHLRLLAGHPDIKPGVALTRVAAWAWINRHVVEEFDHEHLRVNLVMEQGQMLLPYATNYTFRAGALSGYAFEERQSPPDVEAARRRDGDAMPWLSVDRTLWGYRFRVPATWRLVHEADLKVGDVSGRLTIIGLTKVHDAELDAWIENSLQWFVYERNKPFKKVSEVMAIEEKRLKETGTTVVRRRKTEREHGFVYETKFQASPYLGKAYYFIFEGKGVVLRFNATTGTYPINLPRFERFVKEFVLTRERAADPDLELIRDGDVTISAVGGAFTADELKGLKREIR